MFLFFPSYYTTISSPVSLSHDRPMSEDVCHPSPDMASQRFYHTLLPGVWYFEGSLEDRWVYVESCIADPVVVR